jgi:hypothetical protein
MIGTPTRIADQHGNGTQSPELAKKSSGLASGRTGETMNNRPQSEKATAAVPASEKSGSQDFVTTDFFPHQPGTRQVYFYDTTFAPNSATMRIEKAREQKPDGIIENTTARTGVVTDGAVKWSDTASPKSNFPEHYRVQGGFIEIGSHLKNNSEIIWEPKIKLGAKVGDTWTWKPTESMETHYEVLPFSTYKEKRCAVVRSELVIQLNGKRITTENLSWYAKGIGLVKGESKTNTGSGGKGAISQVELQDENTPPQPKDTTGKTGKQSESSEKSAEYNEAHQKGVSVANALLKKWEMMDPDVRNEAIRKAQAEFQGILDSVGSIQGKIPDKVQGWVDGYRDTITKIHDAKPEPKKETSFRVGDITIEIDPDVAKYWTFSNFSLDGRIIEGILVYRGGDPSSRNIISYCYDKDGVKVEEEGLNYQEYAQGEKTKIKIFLNEHAADVRKIKIEWR